MSDTDQATELRRIGDILETAITPPRPEPAPGLYLGRLMAGRWHRRDGTVYARVAHTASPNRGATDGTNDPTGTLPPAVKR